MRTVASVEGSLTGIVRSRIASISWKIAVFAPIPSASDSTPTSVNPGESRSCRIPNRKSCQNDRIPIPPLLAPTGALSHEHRQVHQHKISVPSALLGFLCDMRVFCVRRGGFHVFDFDFVALTHHEAPSTDPTVPPVAPESNSPP